MTKQWLAVVFFVASMVLILTVAAYAWLWLVAMFLLSEVM